MGDSLKRTPLYDLHREFGARLVPFAGYEMPVQYPTGILAEHAQTRTAAGLFDVSHMGQVRLTAKSGQNAAKASAPILLIHGRDDTVVEFRQSTGMADALKDAGKPYRLVELEGEDHWLSKSETRHRMVAESIAFVTQHNPPD